MSDQAAVESYQDEQDKAVTEGWSIQDLASADWALGRMKDLQREIQENNALAELAVARIGSRTEALNARAQRGLEFFRRLLTTFTQTHREMLLQGGKKKSRALPHGTLGFRKAGGGMEVKDKEALLAWARLQPVELGFVRIKEEPAVDIVKLNFKMSGEVPPGCELAEEREEVVVKPELEESHGEH